MCVCVCVCVCVYVQEDSEVGGSSVVILVCIRRDNICTYICTAAVSIYATKARVAQSTQGSHMKGSLRTFRGDTNLRLRFAACTSGVTCGAGAGAGSETC